jgi:hypothetical protein
MQHHRPRLDPRLVVAGLLLAIPLLYVVAQVVLVRDTVCGEADHSQVGALTQLFVPGAGCRPEPPSPTSR